MIPSTYNEFIDQLMAVKHNDQPLYDNRDNCIESLIVEYGITGENYESFRKFALVVKDC